VLTEEIISRGESPPSRPERSVVRGKLNAPDRIRTDGPRIRIRVRGSFLVHNIAVC